MTETPAAPAPRDEAAQARVREHIATWEASCADVVALLRSLTPADWDRPTELPGWDVRAVAAHLAHLEGELAGRPQPQVEVPAAPHVKGFMGQYTESGTIARRDWKPQRIVDELEEVVAERRAALAANPPEDPSAPGPSFAALAGWSWETLLHNRPFDIWMHEQDIRRAVGRPGGLDTPGAAHAGRVVARSLPMVVGKRGGAQAGQSVVLELTDVPHPDLPSVLAVLVGDDGRARACDVGDLSGGPTATVRLDWVDWIRLGGGRASADEVEVLVEGDQELGRRVLAGLAVTP
ncbi:maleylpyruvate isomerase family mycothiol-dependent enzyme [Nocardioides marmoribigeumensis]|uniref:Uncharacterized protein (TIGR03083 family) n=1 Tax=Nocardioides marmoribigeumensis TaxID=433649 RepID=A0ABU2BWT9_9ACTN|nr:maleylpyruvate isomerase family mycothiol-dependent enzyme [Nocardioides marmoribigeumensis]MDR7362593.1 uncharacterized protein (TIGR03083 family) [Nocardioides marmoribigeumensis]